MLVRKFIPKLDYSTITEWWTKQNWAIIPVKALSDTGFLIQDEDGPIAAMWIYTTNSAFTLLEWTVANPEVEPEKRSIALDKLLKYCHDYAILELGAVVLFSSLTNDRLIVRFEAQGFTKTDSNMTNMTKIITPKNGD